MTLATATNKSNHTGNGSTTIFAYDFRVDVLADMDVYFDGVLQVGGYTVQDLGEDVGGTVTFATAPSNGVTVSLVREVPYVQDVDYSAYDRFPEAVHERALDRIVMQVQQLQEWMSRSVSAPIDVEAGTGEFVLPTYDQGKAIIWDVTSNVLVNSVYKADEIGSAAAASAAAALVSQTAAEVAKLAAETAKTAAELAETNAENSEIAAAASELAAAASETAAAASELAAAASETAAAASAAAALVSENNAATDRAFCLAHRAAAEAAQTAAEAAQTAAELAETNAEQAETNSYTHRTAAETALDTFTDLYLGSKTADPTVDNDGDTLQVGALYFNSTTNEMRVWDGTAWGAAYSSGAKYQ